MLESYLEWNPSQIGDNAKIIYTDTDEQDPLQEHSNTLHENILIEGLKFCKHNKWSHHIYTQMVFGTQQKLLLSGGREDFMETIARWR